MNHCLFMERAIELAQLGLGNTSPNPLVGAVIVYKEKIIGEGYHKKYGENHAEVNAINSVKNKSLLKYATIYVTLEPCVHFGKTPPCTDLIINHKIKKVVIGCTDPFEKVKGKGIIKLKKAGIIVEFSTLEKKCIELNKRFFTFHKKKRPYIILKWAETSNGFIDKIRKDEKGIFWISNKSTKSLSHKWRTEEDGILIGGNTFIIDNPKLTAREYYGKNPKSFILDTKASIKNIKNHTLITSILPQNKEIYCNIYLTKILNNLHKENIQSIIIEGGRKTLNSFIKANLWDEARIIVGKYPILNGIASPKIKGKLITKINHSSDIISIYKNDRNHFKCNIY